jgi:hypothetical protein
MTAAPANCCAQVSGSVGEEFGCEAVFGESVLIEGSFSFPIPEVGAGIEPGDRLVVRFIQDFGDSGGALANSLLTGIAEVWRSRS